MSNRSSNGEIAALQVEMETVNRVLEEVRGDVKEIRDLVGKLSETFVTKAEFDRELTRLKSSRFWTTVLTNAGSVVLTFLVTYFVTSISR